MATLENILGFRNLTEVVQGIKSGIPNVLEGTGFINPGRSVSGNKAEYYKITGTRQVARLVHFGAPAFRREMREVDLVPVTLAHTFESQQWPLNLMIALTHMNDLNHDSKAVQQAEYQSGEFKRLFSNLRITMMCQALFQGITYVKSTGNITSQSTSSAYSINYQVPAANQNQLNGLFTVGWQNASAPIMTNLLQLQTQSAQDTGYKLTHAFYDDTVPSYIAKNTEAQQYLARQPGMRDMFLNTGTLPNGFGGIARWIPAGSAFYDDENGVHSKLLTANGVVFTPDPSPEWWENILGSYPVPNSIMPVMGADAKEALKNVTEVYGMFGYGVVSANPTTIEQFAGDTHLPVLKVPGCVYQSVVNF